MANNNVKKPSLTEEQQKALLLLKSTYEMHCNTREEAILKGKTQNIDNIDKVIDETLAQMAQISVDFAKKCAAEHKERNTKLDLSDLLANDSDSDSIFNILDADMIDNEDIIEQSKGLYEQFDNEDVDLYEMADSIEDVVDSFKQEPQVAQQEQGSSIMEVDEAMHNNVDQNAQFDLIPLPSKGECYRLKIDRVPVGYLTASDENLITSPNLYESGSISSILLKKKILNKNINVDNLVSGDVDAIMVFLRGTSYGNDFPIVATDPKTGAKIDTTVDLSKLKYKSFTLKGDENGFFDYTLPKTGAKIKFRFLTKKDERMLQKLNKKESVGVAVFDINDAVDKIKNALKADTSLNDADRNLIIESTDKLNKWSENLSKSAVKNMPYTRTITNSMEMQIVSVNGNTDKQFIHDFVMNMPASDSLAFRRYVYDNQPGVDFEVEVERPVSQGGGTFKCFLEWDDYVFWHIA